MLDMAKLRISELLTANKIRHTAYALSKASQGRINQTTAARLIGGPKRVDLATLDILCDVFKVEPPDLWKRTR